jgi:hypothetical protein
MQTVLLPISFDNVPYFHSEYRGDLIVTHGVIYYFPHRSRVTDEYRRYADLLALMGLSIDLVLDLLEEVRATTNQPKLKGLGLWELGQSSIELQLKLDEHLGRLETLSSRIMDYEYGLPRPMRFALHEIRNISLRGGLWFQTRFDTHDFSMKLFRRKLLREALEEGGFIMRQSME